MWKLREKDSSLLCAVTLSSFIACRFVALESQPQLILQNAFTFLKAEVILTASSGSSARHDASLSHSSQHHKAI